MIRSLVLIALWLMVAVYGIVTIFTPTLEAKFDLLTSIVLAGFVELTWKEPQ